MTYAAFYLPKDDAPAAVLNAVKTQSIKDRLTGAFNSAKTSVKNFDLAQMAKNINLQSATDFTQKYAVAALTMIINQKPVTNQMMLDSLFNGLAPALNITAAQTGFNSLMEMKNAIKAGNINIANFMQGFSNGLSIVTDSMTGSQDYSKYGEEIVIDLLTNFSRNYISETPDRRVQEGQTYNEYLHNLPLTLTFSGMIKDGENYSAHEFSDRLEEVMLNKVPFTFRAGRKIFENYVFTSFRPIRETENGINFEAEIKLIEKGDVEFVKVSIPKQSKRNSVRAQIVNTAKGQEIKNKTSNEFFVGKSQPSVLESVVHPATNSLGVKSFITY